MKNNPSGLTDKDTIDDAFARADTIAHPSGRSYSGVMLRNKDLRRVVVLVREVRSLTAERDRYKTALERIASGEIGVGPFPHRDLGRTEIKHIAAEAVRG